MRIIHAILSALLLLFAIAQYNDPDAVFWIAVYGAGAIWCGLAALRSPILSSGPVRLLFAASLAAAVAGCIWFWPAVENWWMQDVWWEIETAREGMGMMIVLACLLIASLAVLKPART